MATAIDTSFLALDYTRHHYGQPIEAQSEVIPHHWNDHDYVYVAAEFTIEASREEAVSDYDTFTVWVREVNRSLYNSTPCESVTYWESPAFRRFNDAEAYAQFAYQRWQATGTLSSAAMEPRHDLDDRRNPIY